MRALKSGNFAVVKLTQKRVSSEFQVCLRSVSQIKNKNCKIKTFQTYVMRPLHHKTRDVVQVGNLVIGHHWGLSEELIFFAQKRDRFPETIINFFWIKGSQRGIAYIALNSSNTPQNKSKNKYSTSHDKLVRKGVRDNSGSVWMFGPKLRAILTYPSWQPPDSKLFFPFVKAFKDPLIFIFYIERGSAVTLESCVILYRTGGVPHRPYQFFLCTSCVTIIIVL